MTIAINEMTCAHLSRPTVHCTIRHLRESWVLVVKHRRRLAIGVGKMRLGQAYRTPGQEIQLIIYQPFGSRVNMYARYSLFGYDKK